MSHAQLQSTRLRLLIPQQTLPALSIASAQPKKFEQWLDSLPKGHVGQTSRQIYHVSHELSQLKTTAQNRLELLELIRPNALNLLPSLSKHYLNQPLILPEKATKVATLTQALLARLITGYKVVIVEILDAIHTQRNDTNHTKNLKIALHRAISLSTLQLLHNFQLYTLVPKTVWHDLYQLYYIAELQQLLHDPIRAARNSEERSTIEQEFIRAMMLAVANPNQLRQTQIKALYEITALWCKDVKIGKQAATSSVFYLDLSDDAAPSFFKWQSAEKETQIRNVFFGTLIEKLQLHQKSTQSSELIVPENIDSELLNHLCRTWGNSAHRAFSRTPHQGAIDIVVGFSISHYFLAGEMEFSTFIHGGHVDPLVRVESNPFLTVQHDPLAPIPHEEERAGANDIWSFKYTAPVISNENHDPGIDTPLKQIESEIEKNLDTQTKQFYASQCSIVDISPSGYCVQWESSVSGLLRTGEVIGLKDSRNTQWLIGTVRWINQLSNDTVRIGIELLSPNGQACGASVIHKKTPMSDVVRVIELPEISAIGQAATLLTPSACFHVGDKIILSYLNDKVKAKLTKRISSTASYNQFLFERLAQDTENKPEPKQIETNKSTSSGSANDDFNALWNLI